MLLDPNVIFKYISIYPSRMWSDIYKVNCDYYYDIYMIGGIEFEDKFWLTIFVIVQTSKDNQ